MKKRKSGKAISVGGQPTFNWQVQEEGDLGAKVEIATPAHKPRRRRWQILAGCCLLLLVAGIWVGERLLRRAEANLAQVENEVAGALALEGHLQQTSDRDIRPISPVMVGGTSDAIVTVLEFRGSLVLVDVLVNSPVEPWQSKPYRVVRVLREDATGWQPTIPAKTFWGERSTLDTTYFHIDYAQRDALAVREVARTLDDIFLQLHIDLGLRKPRRSERMTIEIATIEGETGSVTGARFRGNTLLIPPPDLLPRPINLTNAQTLRQTIVLSLAEKIYKTAQTEYRVPCQWRAVGQGIGLWLRWEDYDLPSQQRWQDEKVVQEWTSPARPPQLADLISVPRDCRQPPASRESELLGISRPFPRSELSATLIEYLVTTYGRAILTDLLKGFRQYEEWDELAPATTGVSAEELEAGWQAHLLAHTP